MGVLKKLRVRDMNGRGRGRGGDKRKRWMGIICDLSVLIDGAKRATT